jgi:8-oxo-dGTP pyrophosphatase MutT (NUDIX family)
MKKFNNTPNEHILVNGREIWLSRSVAVNCVVMLKNNGKLYVLIGKRGKGVPDSKGKWNLISGYLDNDENGVNCCIREVYEESGVYIPDIKGKILFSAMDQPWNVETDPSANRQNVSLRYGIVIETDYFPEFSTEHSEPDEVADLRWMNINFIKKFEFAFHHEEVILQFLNLISKHI